MKCVGVYGIYFNQQVSSDALPPAIEIRSIVFAGIGVAREAALAEQRPDKAPAMPALQHYSKRIGFELGAQVLGLLFLRVNRVID